MWRLTGRAITACGAADAQVVVEVVAAVVEAEARVLAFVVLEGVRQIVRAVGSGGSGGACKCGYDRQHARDKSGVGRCCPLVCCEGVWPPAPW